MNVTELRELCGQLGVEIEPKASKNEILVELEENGVTWDYVKSLQDNYEKNKPDEDEEEIPKKPEKSERLDVEDASNKYNQGSQLLKMVAQNASFEVMGYSFSRKNPFAVMTATDAQKIIDFYPDKFRLAHPREAQEFYA